MLPARTVAELIAVKANAIVAQPYGDAAA